MALAPSTPEQARRFEAHLRPLLDAAYGIALRFTRDPDDAQDLVQEAAFLAFRAFHQYQEGTRFKAWYFRILTNLFYQKYRRRRREPEFVGLDDVPALYMFARSRTSGLAAREPDPAEAIMSKLSGEQIAEAIDGLPEEFRLVAALHFVEDFGYREIADILAIPLGTVRSRLHRGRRLLQKALWSLAEERGIVPAPPPEDA